MKCLLIIHLTWFKILCSLPDELYPAALEQQFSLRQNTLGSGVSCGTYSVFLLPPHHLLHGHQAARCLIDRKTGIDTSQYLI